MDRTDILILIFSSLLLLHLGWEALQAKRDRQALRHVIYVNGTRGKSTVTRMIAAGLTAGGHRVLCKTTGTLPIAIHPDGRQELIERRAPANIREQLRYLHKAAQEKADILVIECMALQPEYQRVSGRNMLRCDVGVITNARLDHMDVMGGTRAEILDCLMEMLPQKGLIFTAERDFPDQLAARAERLHSTLTISDPASIAHIPGARELDFPENVALALDVCAGLGVDRLTAFEGVKAFVRDSFALSVYGGRPPETRGERSWSSSSTTGATGPPEPRTWCGCAARWSPRRFGSWGTSSGPWRGCAAGRRRMRRCGAIAWRRTYPSPATPPA